MIYFYLVLFAATFGLLGFLFRTFYFPAAIDPKSRQKIESLQKELTERQTELRDARDRIGRTTTNIRSLEQQIKQRDDEMEKLRKVASRQDGEMAALQKEAATIRAELAAGKRAPDTQVRETPAPPVRAAVGAVPVPEAKGAQAKVEGDKGEQKQAATTTPSGAAGPRWRENLDNIVGILDKMEKEIKK